jgi:hypothetical protein
VTKEYTAVENFVTEETPTDKRGKESQYGDEKSLFIRKYAVRDVLKSETKTIQLFEQRIEDDAAFDLAAVIVAVNKLA